MSESSSGQKERFEEALRDLRRESYEKGLRDGLAVAMKIRGWLTRQPDREWQRQAREWADAEIEKAGRKLDGSCLREGEDENVA